MLRIHGVSAEVFKFHSSFHWSIDDFVSNMDSNHQNSHVHPPSFTPAPKNVGGYNLPTKLMSFHSFVGHQLDVPFSNPQTKSREDQIQFQKSGQRF